MRRGIHSARGSLRSFSRDVQPLRTTSRALCVGGRFEARTYTSAAVRGINPTPALTTHLRNAWPRTSARWYASESIKVQTVPPLADSITEGELSSWSKGVGDAVAVDDLVATIETDKVAIEIRAKDAGVIKELFAEPHTTVKVGDNLFSIDTAATPSPKAKPAETAKAAPAPSAAPSPAPSAPQTPTPAPAAAPQQSTPSVKAAAPSAAPSAAPPKPATSSPAPAQAAAAQGGEHRVKASKMRIRVAERLKDSQNTYALLTTFQEADMHNLMQMREEFKDDFQKKHGVKLGFMSAFVKASAAALQANPIINAVFDGKDVIYRNYIDISVAVATPRGLVVPVLRGCDRMSFADIEKTIAALGQRARNDQITIEEMAGGTFTISNGGVYGSMMGTPIVNPPQSAILGMHAITNRAVVVGNEIKIRPVMYLALTYDHRLIDGKDAVTFLRHIKHCVEDPRRLLLDL